MNLHMSYTYEPVFKITFVGTPLHQIQQMIHTLTGHKSLPSEKLEVGVDILSHRIQVDDVFVKLLLVSTILPSFDFPLNPVSYQGVSNSLPSTPSYRGANGIIVSFDKCDLHSYTTAVVGLPKEIKIHFPFHIPTVLVGFITASDAIPTHQVQSVADNLHFSYFETTPSDKRVITDIFAHLTRQMLVIKSQQE